MRCLLLVLWILAWTEVSAQSLIAKLKPHYLSYLKDGSVKHPRLNVLLSTLGVSKTVTLLPSGSKSQFLEGIIEIHLKEETYKKEVITSLIQSRYFQYVESIGDKVNKPLHIPSDPFADPVTGSQDYLSRINAYKAWDISKGDTNSFICFIDNGIEWTHPEFQNKIHYNQADPIDSVDNDKDGYIDNYMGWDFVSNDLYAEDSTGDSGHGTQVAGVATALTNNGLGIASVGYHTKMVPIKIFGNQATSSYTPYAAIIYAADRGCKVINLSWGSTDGFYQYEQDIINHAAIEKDAVLVGATFPTEGPEIFTTPADYDHVISALALYVDDTKAYPQTYHYWIDMSVPAINIFTTGLNGGYAFPSGISVGVPMISATASLVRGIYPWMNALQVDELLRVTGDNIDTVKTNFRFKEKMGHGKLNVYRALTDTTTPALRITDYDLNLLRKDTFSLQLGFKNYLWPTNHAQLTFRSVTGGFDVLDSVASVGKIDMLDSSSSLFSDIVFRILPYPDSLPNELVRIGIEDSSLNYHDYFYFYLDKSSFSSPLITSHSETSLVEPSIHVFPNPTKDWIFVEADELQEVSIWDPLGKMIAKTTGRDEACGRDKACLVSTDIRTQPSGLYVAKIQTKTHSYSYTFLKE